MAEQIERDQRQLVAYRYAVQELRCDLAASQSG